MSVMLTDKDLAGRRLLVVDPQILAMPWYLYPIERGYVISRATDDGECSYTTTKYRAVKGFRRTFDEITDVELIAFAHHNETRVLEGYRPRHCVPVGVVEMPMSEQEYLVFRGLALVDGDGSGGVTINDL
jgi:hypothetical protein